ncbi:GNAT family N-acetyltransferase [Dactylosporangium sucinum]|uniref:N-acetyltransferase n=1 Tax=Dactylosporangium sucinum TaxID=1424081 RepID=A0A917X6N0_9ACTN|nr:GNAT family N-acetyltransferase [Dactylosporangium sucinum]GGM81799.1 N-acetyltransferase [Dactylosporangium sucinum]
MTIVVRPVEPDDFAEVSRLTVEAYRADGQLEDDAGGYAVALADVAARAASAEILVAADGQQLLGSVTFALPGSPYAEVSRTGEAEFRMLAVDPAAQRRGAARRLVQACIDRAEALGCTSLVICTRDVNRAAFALYDTFGFTRDPSLDWSPVPGVRLLGLRLPLQVLAH